MIDGIFAWVLLPVALHLGDRTGLHLVRIRVVVPGGPPPAQQIPALIEFDLDRLQPRMLLVRADRARLYRAAQPVLLGDEIRDPVLNRTILHGPTITPDRPPREIAGGRWDQEVSPRIEKEPSRLIPTTIASTATTAAITQAVTPERVGIR